MKLQKETIDTIIELKQLGFSSREISKQLNVGKSTVNDTYNRYLVGLEEDKFFANLKYPADTSYAKPESIHKGKGPRILILDVETAAAEVLTFGRFKQNIGQDNILKEGGWLLCACWRWIGEEEVYYTFLTPEEVQKADDSRIIAHLFEEMQQADAIIAHNAVGFDHKVIQARALANNFGALPSVKVIDTLVMAKKALRLPSNRLDSIGEYFGLGRKVDTGGIDLWKRVQRGDEDAMLEMLVYCKQDVNLLHDVYLKLRAIGNKANFNAGLYFDDEHKHCPTCGSTCLSTTGREVSTTLSSFKEIICLSCGSRHRERTTKTTKEDRSKLLSAVK